MITDVRRELPIGERDLSAPAAGTLGAVLVLMGITGFLAVGRGVLLGVFQVAMPHNILHLAAGTVLVSSAILGSRPARLANGGAALLFLLLGVIGVSGVHPVVPNSADAAFYLTLGLTFLAVGRLAPR